MLFLQICNLQGYSIIRQGYGVFFGASFEVVRSQSNLATAIDLLSKGKGTQRPVLRIVITLPIGSRRILNMVHRLVFGDAAINTLMPIDWQPTGRPNQFRITCPLYLHDFHGYDWRQGTWLTREILELRRLTRLVLSLTFKLRIEDVELKERKTDAVPRMIAVPNRAD